MSHIKVELTLDQYGDLLTYREDCCGHEEVVHNQAGCLMNPSPAEAKAGAHYCPCRRPAPFVTVAPESGVDPATRLLYRADEIWKARDLLRQIAVLTSNIAARCPDEAGGSHHDLARIQGMARDVEAVLDV